MGIFDGPKANEIDNWVCVLERSTNYEVEMAKNYLASLKIPSNILSKRDSAYSLTVSEMALVYLYVPKEYETKARKALNDLEKEIDNEDNQD
jgi:hypothetical protein